MSINKPKLNQDSLFQHTVHIDGKDRVSKWASEQILRIKSMSYDIVSVTPISVVERRCESFSVTKDTKSSVLPDDSISCIAEKILISEYKKSTQIKNAPNRVRSWKQGDQSLKQSKPLKNNATKDLKPAQKRNQLVLRDKTQILNQNQVESACLQSYCAQPRLTCDKIVVKKQVNQLNMDILQDEKDIVSIETKRRSTNEQSFSQKDMIAQLLNESSFNVKNSVDLTQNEIDFDNFQFKTVKKNNDHTVYTPSLFKTKNVPMGDKQKYSEISWTKTDTQSIEFEFPLIRKEKKYLDWD